jgi:hypothetical protein
MGAFAGEFDSVKPVAPKHAAPLVLVALVGKNAIDIGLRWSPMHSTPVFLFETLYTPDVKLGQVPRFKTGQPTHLHFIQYFVPRGTLAKACRWFLPIGGT